MIDDQRSAVVTDRTNRLADLIADTLGRQFFLIDYLGGMTGQLINVFEKLIPLKPLLISNVSKFRKKSFFTAYVFYPLLTVSRVK